MPNNESYPLQYPPSRPNPVPVQPRSANPHAASVPVSTTSTPSATPNYQTQFHTSSASSSATFHYDDPPVIGAGGTTDSPKPWPGKLPTDSNPNLYTDPYNTGKTDPSHDFTPNVQHTQLHGRHDDPNRWSFDSAYARPPGLKRFTGAWFKWQWRLQVSRRRMPRLLYILSGVLLMAGWLSITLSFTNNLKSNEAKNSAGDAINGPQAPGSPNDTFVSWCVL